MDFNSSNGDVTRMGVGCLETGGPGAADGALPTPGKVFTEQHLPVGLAGTWWRQNQETEVSSISFQTYGFYN